MIGYYLMHRGWEKHPVFGKEFATRRFAWIWMVGNAAWDYGLGRYYPIGSGNYINVPLGTLGISIPEMACHWQWRGNKVRKFLLDLENIGMISVIESNFNMLLIEIKGYLENNYVKSYNFPREYPAFESSSNPFMGNGHRYISKGTRDYVFAKSGGFCSYCGVLLNDNGVRKFHVDHKKPVSKGGSDSKKNLVAACASCNLRKNNKSSSEFIRSLHFGENS